MISGSAGGRTLKPVAGSGTRPTADKVKEAIFSMIGPYFSGGWGLDLFAGTGGLGIEALSRGLEKVVFVDRDHASVRIVQHNLQVTGLDGQAEVYRNDAMRALQALERRQLKFDLVFLDPPYKMRCVEEIALRLQQTGLAGSGAVLVAEHDAADPYGDDLGGFTINKRAKYGGTMISIYSYREHADAGGEQQHENDAE